LVACPRVSPEYELNAVHALMKPNERTKGKIAHTAGRQEWSAEAAAVVEAVLREGGERLAFAADLHRPAEGDYWFAFAVPAVRLEEAKGLALAISVRLPATWLTLGRLLVRDGRFFRRQHGYKLRIVPATNVHLRREIRGALKGLL
jgi:hypothetical protein